MSGHNTSQNIKVLGRLFGSHRQHRITNTPDWDSWTSTAAVRIIQILITKLNTVIRFTKLYFLNKLLEWSDVMVKNLGPLSFLPNRSYRNQRMSACHVSTIRLLRSAVFISSLGSNDGYSKHFQEHFNNTGRPLC